MSEQAKTKVPAELPAVPPKAGAAIAAIVPRDVQELKYIAGLVVSAGMAPDSYGNDPKKIALGIMKGAEVGLAPLTALQWIAIINNRPTIWGDGAIALVQSKGHLEKMEVKEIGKKPGVGDETNSFAEDYGYHIRLWRKEQDQPYEGEFTVGDAKRAKLWMNPKRPPWMLYPKRMLKWRAIGFAIRDGFADDLAGMMIREEVEDLPAPPKDITPDFLDDEQPTESQARQTPLTVEAPGEVADGEEAAEASPAPSVADDQAPDIVWPQYLDDMMHMIAEADEERLAAIENDVNLPSAPDDVRQAIEAAIAARRSAVENSA